MADKLNTQTEKKYSKTTMETKQNLLNPYPANVDNMASSYQC